MSIPNPCRLDVVLTMDGVDAYKRYDCQRYVKCLDVAEEEGWPQFHCNNCTAYVALPKDDPSRRLFARIGQRLIKNGHNK